MLEERATKSEASLDNQLRPLTDPSPSPSWKANRAELEAKLLEMRRAMQQLEQKLGAELREAKAALARAEGGGKQSELELGRLKRELADLQSRLAQLQREKSAFEKAVRELEDGKLQMLEDEKKRRVRAGVHLATLIWERSTALHFACSYYLWAQVASEGAMARGAAELNKITANVMDRRTDPASYEGFDYDVGAIDVAAAAREFGL